jgi:O-acetyl-ADP-ribose deacetylase (regulator of RNase III)
MGIGIGLHCWYCEHGPCTGICKEDMCQESPFTDLAAEAKLKARYSEVTGNLITLAKQGEFDVIAHGCNCFCTMGAGIAPHMAREFGANQFNLEITEYPEYDDHGNEYVVKTKNRGDINKLGNIDYQHMYLWFKHPYVKEDGLAIPMNSKSPGQPDVKDLIVVNAYTQYNYGANHKDGVAKPVDYEAITMCMRKMNVAFKGKHIGLPKIGAGLAGGDWDRIKKIIQTELIDCKVTIVILPQ